jgi:uncharacterized protein with HEPN domain
MRPRPENNLVYFLTILESAGKLGLYSRGFSNARDFFHASDQLHFNASLLLLSTIGDQISKISDDTKQKYNHVPWHNIKAMRNRIAHDYRGLDYEITYEIISREIPVLKQQIEAIVAAEMSEGVLSLEELEVAKINPLWYRNVDFEAFKHRD